MTPQIQQKVRYSLFIIAVLVGVFELYAGSAYLREELVVNPVAYDRFDVVVLGDSITEGLGATPGKGYVSLLREHTGVKIRNSGVRSDTTLDALLRFEEDVLDHDPDIVVIALGGNDFLRRYPEEDTFGNLRTMIEILQEEEVVVLLVGIPGGMFVDTYAEYFDLLVEETGVAFVPNVLEGVIGKWKYMKDPIHPNDLGHQIIFERVSPALDELLEIYY
jgi:lysophospholipase L1-like esterase